MRNDPHVTEKSRIAVELLQVLVLALVLMLIVAMGLPENAHAITWPAVQDSATEVIPVPVYAGMTALPDEGLAAVNAQGLFWSDKILGNELAGANPYSTPFTFYRVGLDADLAINTNISKLQLGCGGVNDFLNAKAGCDIDIDYASLMGRNGVEPGSPLSAFTLRRPYLEFAVKNDGSANREIVGIKIGTQSADGAMSAGRVYETAGAVNQENQWVRTIPATGGKPDNVCQPGDSTGGGVLGCHSGINSVSGFLGTEMSLSMNINVTVCGLIANETHGGTTCHADSQVYIPFVGWTTVHLPDIGISLNNVWGCAGRTSFTGDDPDNCDGADRNDALFIDLAGTRMNTLGLKAAALYSEGSGLAGLLDLLNLDTLYASLDADLRLVHKIVFENTGDFFLSFQREPVAYPRYSKRTPVSDPDVAYMDACKTSTYNQARCGSAYAVPANTGWWLNAPSVKLRDVKNDNVQLGHLLLGDATALFSAPGYSIDQAEFELFPARNCYGATRFC